MQNNLIDNNKESNKKLKLIEEENEIKLMKILGDKNLEIGQLKNDLENLNKINNNLLISLKRLEEEKNAIEINLNNKINELNTQLSFLKSELDKNQIHSNLLMEQMKNDYNNNISSLLREKDNKIKNIYINQKIEFDNLNNEIKSLKRDNLRLNGQIEQNEKNCENSFNELQKENFCLYNENKFMQDQNNEIFNKYKNIEEYLMNVQNENEVFKKNIEEQNEEINKKGNEILYLNNKMNSLKNSNDLLEETNQKLKQYNGQLQCINENMSVEFSNKLKNLNYIENQNCILTRENEKLKNQIREYGSYSFNKIC
jgi:chromosome segregation ATPase